MKARLLIVTDEEEYEYKQNTNGEVYDNQGGWVSYSNPASFIIDESSYHQWRTEYLAHPTMTVASVDLDARTITVGNRSQAPNPNESGFEAFQRRRQQERETANETSRARARRNIWEQL